MGNKHGIDKKHQVHHTSPPAPADGRSTVQQLAFTAAGAAGSALLGAILTRQGYEPKTVSGTIAALGAGLASVGDSDAMRALGAGAMSASGAQLVLILFSEHDDRKHAANDVRPTIPDAASANVLPLAAKAVAS